ncbi:MAG TPA: hypothetical protein VIL30_03170 [Ramlibacter sp.]
MLNGNFNLSGTALGMLVAAVLVVGCGGGSDSPADPAPAAAALADKYVGTWASCSRSGTTFTREVVTFAKSSNTELTGRLVERTSTDAACTGTLSSTGLSAFPTFVNPQITSTANPVTLSRAANPRSSTR